MAGNNHGGSDAQEEQRAWWLDALAPYVVSGCLPAVPSSSLTLDAFACNAYVQGTGQLIYITQSSKALGPLSGGNGTYWLALSRDVSSVVSGWTRQPGSHYLWQLSASQPATPSGGLIFAQVTVAGGVITAVSRIHVKGDDRILDVTRGPYNTPRDGTGNAATGINQALLDASAGGYKVFLPCGTYRTTAEIILQANTELYGASRDCTVIAPDTGTLIPRPVKALSVNRVYVHDVQVDCGDGAVVGRQGIAGLNSTSYMRVERTLVKRCGQYGITFGDTSSFPFSSGGHGIEWIDNIVDMTTIPSGACTGTIAMEHFPRGGSGFYVEPGPLIQGNTVLGGAADNGIKINNARGGRIVGNWINGASCSTAAGAITIAGSSGTIIANNHITDTRLGMVVSSAPRSAATGGNDARNNNIVIEGNTLRKFSESGIFGSDGNQDMLIRNNTLILDSGAALSAIAFQPQPAASGGDGFARLTIQGNHIVGFVTGMSLAQDTGATLGFLDLVINENLLSTGVATPGYAITVDIAPNSIYSNNIIIGYRNGIRAGGTGGSLGVRMQGNTMRDLNPANSASEACLVVVGNYPQILGNRCVAGAGHPKYGLSLNGSTYPMIEGNQWIGMETGDLVLLNTGSMTAATPSPQAYYTVNPAFNGPADTNENTIASVTLPKSYFSLFGGIEIEAFGEIAGAGGTKDLRLYFGGTLLGAALNTGVVTTTYRMSAIVSMQGTATTAQHAYVQGWEGTVLELAAFNSLTVDTVTNTVEVKLTCQKASAGDTCRQRSFIVKPWR